MSGDRRRRAFTMLEVMVATLILVLGIIPVYNLMTVQSGQARFNRDREFSAALASRVLARLRAMPSDELGRLREDAAAMKTFLAADPILHPFLDETVAKDASPLLEEWETDMERTQGRFETTVTMDPLEATMKEGPFDVVVEVSWNERLAAGAKEVRRSFVLAQVLGSPWLPTGKVGATK